MEIFTRLGQVMAECELRALDVETIMDMSQKVLDALVERHEKFEKD